MSSSSNESKLKCIWKKAFDLLSSASNGIVFFDTNDVSSTKSQSSILSIKISNENDENVVIQLYPNSSQKSDNKKMESNRQPAGGPVTKHRKRPSTEGLCSNLYRSTFGPTLDETFLVGMETLHKFYSSDYNVSTKPEIGSDDEKHRPVTPNKHSYVESKITTKYMKKPDYQAASYSAAQVSISDLTRIRLENQNSNIAAYFTMGNHPSLETSLRQTGELLKMCKDSFFDIKKEKKERTLSNSSSSINSHSISLTSCKNSENISKDGNREPIPPWQKKQSFPTARFIKTATPTSVSTSSKKPTYFKKHPNQNNQKLLNQPTVKTQCPSKKSKQVSARLSRKLSSKMTSTPSLISSRKSDCMVCNKLKTAVIFPSGQTFMPAIIDNLKTTKQKATKSSKSITSYKITRNEVSKSKSFCRKKSNCKNKNDSFDELFSIEANITPSSSSTRTYNLLESSSSSSSSSSDIVFTDTNLCSDLNCQNTSENLAMSLNSRVDTFSLKNKLSEGCIFPHVCVLENYDSKSSTKSVLSEEPNADIVNSLFLNKPLEDSSENKNINKEKEPVGILQTSNKEKFNTSSVKRRNVKLTFHAVESFSILGSPGRDEAIQVSVVSTGKEQQTENVPNILETLAKNLPFHNPKPLHSTAIQTDDVLFKNHQCKSEIVPEIEEKSLKAIKESTLYKSICSQSSPCSKPPKQFTLKENMEPVKKLSESNRQRNLAPNETRYAITRVTKYDDFTTYEVLKSTKAVPKVMPMVTEGVFIVKNTKDSVKSFENTK